MNLRHTLLMAIAVVALGCAPVQPPPSSPGSNTTERRAANQTMRYAVTNIPVSMSIEATETVKEQYYLLYDPVVTLIGLQDLQPWAASKWELVNPTTWRLTFRNDLTFSNGDKLTAADVEFTAKFVLENKTPPISQLSNLAEVKMVDDYTVDFISRTSDVSTLVGLSSLYIMPKKYFESVGRQGFAQKPIGSGPYELVEFTSGQSARYKLRSTPHAFRKPSLTEITVQALPQNSSSIAGLKTGDLDLVSSSYTSDELAGMEREGFIVTTAQHLTQGQFVLFPKTETDARNLPTKDKRVRLALNYAIDREGISKAFYGGRAQPSSQLVAPGGPFHDPNLKPFPYDPARAKQLLAEAGYPNGFTLTTPADYNATYANSMIAIQGNLRDIGVNIEIAMNEQGIYVEKFRGTRPKGDLYITALNDGNGFNSTIRSYFSCDIPYNTLGNQWYCNPEFDRLHAQAATEPDVARRAVILQQAARLAVDDVCCIFNVYTPAGYRIHQGKLKGLQLSQGVWNMDAIYLIE